MKLQIIPSDKLIIIDGRTLIIEYGDLSWIPNNVHVFRWDDSSGEGEIETNDQGNVIINQLGIYSKAVEIFNEEIVLIEERDRLEMENRDWSSIIRIERNIKLTDCDWVITKAKETGTNIPVAWKTYRQALRDLPANINSEDYMAVSCNLNHSLWPVKPSS